MWPIEYGQIILAALIVGEIVWFTHITNRNQKVAGEKRALIAEVLQVQTEQVAAGVKRELELRIDFLQSVIASTIAKSDKVD